MNLVGASDKTIEYAFYRVYKNMREMKLGDLGLALVNVQELKSPENIIKIVKKAEQHIGLTHKKLLKGNNLQSVITLCRSFNQIGSGNSDLWRKLENLLEKQLEMAREPLDK